MTAVAVAAYCSVNSFINFGRPDLMLLALPSNRSLSENSMVLFTDARNHSHEIHKALLSAICV